MEGGDIQNMLSNVDPAPQEEPVPDVVDLSAASDLQLKKSLVTKIKSVIQMAVALLVGCFNITLPVQEREEEGQGTVGDIELGMDQPVVSIEEDSNETDQSTPPDLRLEQSPVTSNIKSVIQVTVALLLAGGSFGVMFQVPGAVNDLGRVVMSDTIGFNLFLVADSLVFFASLVVAMIVATASHISAKLEYFISITLLAAVVCFVLSFLGAEYVVVFTNHK